MYLFVFVMLLVSILGLYMQAFLLQVGSITQNQSAIAGIMLDWHDGAYQTVDSNAPITGLPPCTVTSGWGARPWAECMDQIQAADLPTGYAIGTYRFPTVVFQEQGTNRLMVLTYLFLPPGDNPNNPLTIPGLVSTGYTLGEIFQQMQKTNAPRKIVGTVVGTTFHTLGIDPTSTLPITYALPPGLNVPDGAKGYISPVLR